MKTFHHKILRGVLKLSQRSPSVSLYFLLGELPIEAVLHLDILSLFWSIWANPETKVYLIVKYLLMMSNEKSLTWSAHINVLFRKYNLPDPLTLLNDPVWKKERWKEYLKTMVTVHHERCLRDQAVGNPKLQYLNVSVNGLTGKRHPTLYYIEKTFEAERARVHIKMLAGDYPCFKNLARDGNVPPFCRICSHETIADDRKHGSCLMPLQGHSRN